MKPRNPTCPAAFIAVLMTAGAGMAAESESPAPYLDEVEAVVAGEKLGIGSAERIGPDSVTVFSHQSLSIDYKAGPAGIQPGGGVIVALRHVFQWSTPQNENPKALGYTTVHPPDGVRAETLISMEFNKDLTWRFFPWQNLIRVTFPERGLEEGQTLRISFGDRSQGSPGIRVQPFDEFPFTFKIYVDALGTDNWLPLAHSPSVYVIADEPRIMNVVMPTNAVAGEPTWCIVRAEDLYGNPAPTYRGTVRFNSTSTKSKLHASYTFTETDRGVHRFEPIVFNETGDFTITVADGTLKAQGNPVRVSEKRAKHLLLWGDLHGHTLHSDGRGTVEEFYDFAERVAGLDFCAVTDHAFEITDAMWEHSKRVTNRVNKPGRFVTYQAYEWSGQTDVGGDHNIFFLDDDPPIYRSRSYYNYRNLQMYHGSEPQVNHVEDLFKVLRPQIKNKDIFAIPHWGGRRGNPAWHDPKVQRMIEVFSEHQRSEEWMTQFLKNRYRLGIIAGTDGHYGNPGYGYLRPKNEWDNMEIGMAAVAVYAEEHTRESIFHALYDRRVYATSGDRIILDFIADDRHGMGTEYETNTAPTLRVHVVGTAPIARIEFKKDSEIVHTVAPESVTAEAIWQDKEFSPDRETCYYVRIVQTNNEEAISSPIWINPGAITPPSAN